MIWLGFVVFGLFGLDEFVVWLAGWVSLACGIMVLLVISDCAYFLTIGRGGGLRVWVGVLGFWIVWVGVI